MKRFCACLLFVLSVWLAHPSALSATDYVTSDGSWWTSLTDDEQLLAVRAMIAAYSSGYNDGFIHAVILDQMHYHSTRSSAQATNDPAMVINFSKTFGVYQQEIIDFYSGHPSSMDVPVAEVLDCLADSPVYTCEQVANMHQ